MIKIILAEDHNVVRNGIKALLEKEKDYKIVGEAVNSEQLLTILQNQEEPDILLSDINMPGVNGLDLIPKLRETHQKMKIVMLSMLDKEKYIAHAFSSGANGFLLKSITPDELIFAIRHVHMYGKYICSELSLRLLDKLLATNSVTENQPSPSDLKLSVRDLEVLLLIADGLTNAEIAEKLFTSKRTAEGYRKGLMEKTGSVNTASLIKFAMKNNLIE
ncbi:response regulator transcription factor [Mucilaginibacter ginkgonis]|uniref:Response regulator transcription factor n=1 Tax=Mucilaginibacter ginkgonis TaxID=2682091 RepID=A0A6I4I0X4_9SPHI|nr:response regulator transcription factor [Mucilaginibacter ginkgonis]QQL51223.1 response regulator transcription factor [Mucilaginibacter ginkgonis]